MGIARAITLVTLVTAGCTGTIGGQADPDAEETPATTPSDVDEPGFDNPGDQPLLLPFWVRLARVADVAGVTEDDPLLSTLRAKRVDLGDHDHANGIQASQLWNASRMKTWVDALQPVCASDQLRDRFLLPADLDGFIEAAYGRVATDDEKATMALAVEGLGPDATHQTLCLAIFTSAEFVIQ